MSWISAVALALLVGAAGVVGRWLAHRLLRRLTRRGAASGEPQDRPDQPAPPPPPLAVGDQPEERPFARFAQQCGLEDDADDADLDD